MWLAILLAFLIGWTANAGETFGILIFGFLLVVEAYRIGTKIRRAQGKIN